MKQATQPDSEPPSVETLQRRYGYVPCSNRDLALMAITTLIIALSFLGWVWYTNLW